jgi:hypothetical protein
MDDSSTDTRPGVVRTLNPRAITWSTGGSLQRQPSPSAYRQPDVCMEGSIKD